MTMPAYSPAQMAYLKAKALFDTCRQVCMDRRAAEIPQHMYDSEEGIEAAVDMEMRIEAETDMPTARQLLREAEDNLIVWARSVVRRLPQYKPHAATLEPLWDAKLLAVRDKLLALAVKLAA